MTLTKGKHSGNNMFILVFGFKFFFDKTKTCDRYHIEGKMLKYMISIFHIIFFTFGKKSKLTKTKCYAMNK